MVTARSARGTGPDHEDCVSLDATSRVNAARLWDRHQRMALHGGLPNGGVDRQALSPEEFAAWRELIDWARPLGLAAFTDVAGNLFLRHEGTLADAPAVLTGSHLDSQPTGGKFDGVFGVLAGLEAVQAIIESGTRLLRPIEIVAWMNEEGSRFAPGMMGSAAYTRAETLDRFLPICDRHGTSVADGLAALHRAFPSLPLRELGRPMAAYLEAHIEQGPVLEREGVPIGVVTGIQGKRTYRVSVRGEEAHAGTSSRRERKDALLAAVRIIHALTEVMHDAADTVKFTVGKFDVLPDAPSVVPASVVFSIDLRHIDSGTLVELGNRIEAICVAHAQPCTVDVLELTTALSLDFPEAMTSLVRESARLEGIAAMDIRSAAGHDARFLHGFCPTAMIFVPCKDGVSHNPMESAKAEDLAAGARVLVRAMVALASQ